jgi:hypothetical protein
VGRHREEKGTGKENETELKEKFLHKTFPQVRKALQQTFPRYRKLSNKHSPGTESSSTIISPDILNKYFL